MHSSIIYDNNCSLIHNFHPKIYHIDNKYHLTLNIIFSAVQLHHSMLISLVYVLNYKPCNIQLKHMSSLNKSAHIWSTHLRLWTSEPTQTHQSMCDCQLHGQFWSLDKIKNCLIWLVVTMKHWSCHFSIIIWRGDKELIKTQSENSLFLYHKVYVSCNISC
jgi:hypothetical protein